MKILFLGNESSDNKLFKILQLGENITYEYKKITLEIAQQYDFIISYGYRHIVKKNIINHFNSKSKYGIVNLHISYLPFNRGADPNLWSILTNTPSGITIHVMDVGLDTGDILCQKMVKLDYELDTMKTSYEKLQNEIIQLFLDNWNKIKNNRIVPIKQNHERKTIHYLKDRPNNLMPESWDTKIKDVQKNYLNQLKKNNIFNINGKIINKTYFIAELSCNHNQDINIAYKLIKSAYESGANAIKLQTYTADTMTIDSHKSYFTDCLDGTLWEGKSLYELYKSAYTPWEWTKELKKYSNELGMELFSSPFDKSAVDFLEKLDIPCYKIASFEIVDHILIKKIAQTGKPVIISSGMASKIELKEAIHLLRENGCNQIAMLKCTSAYPAKPKDANLITMKDMVKSFNIVPGLSDHTLGNEVAITSVILGGKIIEKHFTLSRESGSADDAFSLTPNEFRKMVDKIRVVEKTIGKITYGTKSEMASKKFRKSLFVIKNIKKNDIITTDHIRPIRPGYGLHTKYYDLIIGKTINQDVERGEPLKLEMINGISI